MTTIEAGDYLRRRSLELLLDGARWSISTFGHLFVVWLLAWIQSQAVGIVTAGAWAGVLSTVLVFQAVYATIWSPQAVEALDDFGVRGRLAVFTSSAWIVGVCWAVAGVVLYPVELQELQMFLVFVMGGMSLAAVGTQHVYLPACYGSMGFAVPVLAARYALEGYWIEPVLLVLYTLVILRLARMLSRFSRRSSSLQFERDGLLRELTARARDLDQARRDAEEANLAKSRFLAHASHDLRQPLHAIGLFVESLSNDDISPRVVHVVDRIKDSLGMLSNMFDALLDITVLDARTTKVNPVDFSLQELFDALEKDFAPIAEENNVTLRMVSTSIFVRTDPILFRRLVQNLISNAIRYCPGARVVVGARRSGRDGCRILVADGGPGISELDQRRIFQEFVKLESSETRQMPGLGLGLAIVERLSRVLRLTIELKSGEGSGTRFVVSGIERGGEASAVFRDEGAVDSGGLLAGKRVLIVEDDPDVLDATGALLRRWGCEVQQMLMIPRTLPDVDIVISDRQIGDEDGLEFLRRISLHRPDVRTMLISGDSSQGLREMANSAGVPLLHKPVRPVRLRSLLLHLLVQEV
ncbi:MAG: hybrid sensor histidine kinase/response regulator [Pseudomonadales bacterium]